MFENFELLPLLISLATFVAGLLEGRGIVPVVGWLKTRLGTNGIWTVLVAGLVSLLFGTVTVFAGGQVTPEIFNVDHILLITGMAFIASQGIYLDWKNSQ